MYADPGIRVLDIGLMHMFCDQKDLNLEKEPLLPPRYENRGIIGQGGMGVVFHAYDLQMQREVSVKVLLFDGCKDEKMQERFQREAKSLAALSHANIVKLLSWGLNENGNPYNVMEFLQGVPLSGEIGNGKRLTLARFKEIFCQVLSGLAHIHEQGIVHRDIKPSNIILCRQAEGVSAKIIDFGIARINDLPDAESAALTQTGALLGSPAYMSPEQCKGERVNHLSDIYSLACVMYEALTGEVPHKGDTALEIMYKHMNAETTSLADLPAYHAGKQLGQLVDRCLSKEPGARCQSANEILQQINEILSGRFTTRRFFLEAETRPAKRITPVSAVLIGLVILAVAGLVWSASTVREKNIAARGEEFSKMQATEASKLRTIAELKRSVVRLDAMYRHAETRRIKLDCAEELLTKLKLLSDAQLAVGDYGGATSSLKQCIPLTRLVNPESKMRTTAVLTAMADCLTEQKKYGEAKELIDKAIKEFDPTGKAQLQPYAITSAQLKLEIRSHSFDRGGEYFRFLAESTEKRNMETAEDTKFWSRYTKLPSDPVRVKRAHELFLLIAAERLTEVPEKLAALAFINRIASLEFEEGSNLSRRTIDHAMNLLKEIPASSPGFSPVAQETYSLDSRCRAEAEAGLQKSAGSKKKPHL